MTRAPCQKSPRWLLCLGCSYAAILAALSVVNSLGADRWWLKPSISTCPRRCGWFPCIFLILVSLREAPSLVWLPVLCTVWVLGPIMGFCWPLHGATQPQAISSIRILTWNAKFGRHDMQALLDDMQRNRPDVVLLQDATCMANDIVTLFRGWHVQSYDQYMIASRLPVTGAETIRFSLPGQQVVCLRCQVHTGARTVTIYNVHFESPRGSLNAFRVARKRPWYLPTAIQQLQNNIEARLAEARTVQRLLRSETNPVVVAATSILPILHWSVLPCDKRVCTIVSPKAGEATGIPTATSAPAPASVADVLVDADRSHPD